MERETVKESARRIYSVVEKILLRENLPKGFARHLACLYVGFKCDVEAWSTAEQGKTPCRHVALEALRAEYKDIVQYLKTLNGGEGKGHGKKELRHERAADKGSPPIGGGQGQGQGNTDGAQGGECGAQK